jgi:hypothetical protein
MLHRASLERGYADMPMVRAVGFMVCAAAAAAVGGCAGARVHAEPPAGVSLAGSWKLDHAASDDPEKILAKMRAEARRLMSRRQVVSEPRPGARGGAAGGREAAEPGADEDLVAADVRAHGGDPLLRSRMAHVIRESIARGDFLTVRQGLEEFVLDYGSSQRSFTPGQHSVVSTEGGVGDQISGWKGREYVIDLRAQIGPEVTERYGLSADGKHLIEKLHIGSAELPAVELTRVYNPTGEAAPRQLPLSD